MSIRSQLGLLSSRTAVCAALALLAIGGCGKEGPAVAKVSGRVIYRGRPVARATVTFTPLATGVLPAIGVTDERGVYQLGTFGAGDGATIGGHRVSIVAHAPYRGPVPAGAGGALLEELEDRGAPLIPLRYFRAETSNLTAEVKPGSNRLDFQLTGDLAGNF